MRVPQNHIDNFSRVHGGDIVRGEIYERNGKLCVEFKSPEEFKGYRHYPIDFLYIRTLEEILTGAIKAQSASLAYNSLQLSITD